MLFLFVIRKVSLLGTLQNIAGWDGITEITSEGQFEMNIPGMYVTMGLQKVLIFAMFVIVIICT